MDYAESTRYLISLGNEVRAAGADGVLAAKLGLDNITALLDDLGRPQDSYPSVLVAGTNGKGSVAAMLEAILRAAGLRTGLYTSPHLVEITERIQILGESIPPQDFAELFNRLRSRIEKLLAAGALRFHPTYFECLTAMAMEYFREQRCEFVVFEVGMGGRLDATNAATPRLSVITQIDFDHERFLGSTIAAIAGEKAGIIKPRSVAVSAASHPDAADVIRRKAAESGTRLVEVWKEYSPMDLAATDGAYQFTVRDSSDFSLPVRPALRGRHQVENALAAVAAARELSSLGFAIGNEAMQQGLASVRWPGRLELVRSARLPAGQKVFLDGAHNPAGARALAHFWAEHFSDGPIVLVYGAMRDKAIAEITELLFPKVSAVVLTQPNQDRAASPAALRDLSHHLNPHLVMEPEPVRAMERAIQISAGKAVIFATGSLFLVGDLRKAGYAS